MRIAVPKEIGVDERRIALVPDVAARLVQEGLESDQ
jgi:alanine dehydrogenase